MAIVWSHRNVAAKLGAKTGVKGKQLWNLMLRSLTKVKWKESRCHGLVRLDFYWKWFLINLIRRNFAFDWLIDWLLVWLHWSIDWHPVPVEHSNTDHWLEFTSSWIEVTDLWFQGLDMPSISLTWWESHVYPVNLQGLFLGIMHTTKSCRSCINFRLRQDPQVNCNMFPRYIHTWKVGKRKRNHFFLSWKRI